MRQAILQRRLLQLLLLLISEKHHSSQQLANHKHSLMSPEEKLSVHFALLIATVHHGIALNWSISGTGSAQRVTLLKTTTQTGVETRMAEVRERERGRKPVQVHTVCALLYKSAVMNREARGVSNKASSNCFFCMQSDLSTTTATAAAATTVPPQQ